MTTYLFHATLLISGFTLFYWLILRHETYFRLNRWVMMAGVTFCLALPFVQIPASMSFWKDTYTPTESIMETITQAPAQIVAPKSTPNSYETKPSYEPIDESAASTGGFSWVSILGIIYIVGVVIFLLVFLMQLVILMTQRYNLNSFQTGKYTIVEMIKDSEPCSFLNYIFINPDKYDEETYNHIIEHEKAHIDQSHFIDKVIAELLLVLFWFNPFTWLLRKSISQNLEFLTDQSLIKKGIEKKKYQMSLLKVSVSNRPLNLTASYNSSFLKNRINMMNSQNSSAVSAWKYLFILPLFVISIASLNAIQGNTSQSSNTPINQSTTQSDYASDKQNWSSEEGPVKPVSRTGYISKNLNLPTIDKIALAMSGNLNISFGKEQSITVFGPEELVNNISTDVFEGNWQVTYNKQGYRKNSSEVKVSVQLTDLTHLALSGAGNITTVNRFETTNEIFVALSGTGNIDFTGDAKFLNTALSGTGNIRIDGNVESMNTALSGSGNVTISGTSPFARFVSSGSGNISASELKSKRVEVVSDGASTISLDVEEHLEVTAAGIAVIRYRGNPIVKKDLKDEARIERLN